LTFLVGLLAAGSTEIDAIMVEVARVEVATVGVAVLDVNMTVDLCEIEQSVTLVLFPATVRRGLVLVSSLL